MLTDGSQGMISQVMGLAKKFNKEKIIEIETKLIFPWSILQPGFLPIFSWIFLNKLNLSIAPDIIISCGRKSVYLSIYFKKKYKNIINIHIQNPKISFNNFNYIVAPQHDLIKGENIINSIGALHKFDDNKFKNVQDNIFKIPKKKLVSVFIGGNNRHYNFYLKEINDIIFKIKNLKTSNIEYNFLILISRRTSNKIEQLLKDELSDIAIVWNKNKSNPYEFALKNSSFFIVTSDSTSMISECAFTGNPIYVYHLPFKRKSKRIERFHYLFQKLKITKKIKGVKILLPWKYDSLNESERISSIIKKRIIKHNS